MKITKRSGSIVLYDDERLVKSILRANAGTTEEISERAAAFLADVVLGRLVRKHDIVTTDLIRQEVIDVLREQGYPWTADRYANYTK